MAEEVNTNVDNIGARRLHTILERILEDVSFDAPEKVAAAGVVRIGAMDSCGVAAVQPPADAV